MCMHARVKCDTVPLPLHVILMYNLKHSLERSVFSHGGFDVRVDTLGESVSKLSTSQS